MTIDEMIAVLEAFKAGKEVQWRYRHGKEWFPCAEPVWDFSERIYRVKPEPRTIWVNEYPNGLAHAAFHSERECRLYANDNAVRSAIKFVEVI